MQNININRNNKDRLFCYIFGREDHKDWTLSLYNAVNHTHYDDPEQLIIFTIENVVYMSMKDDVAFLIQDNLNLYEQQSTFNPNMPVRMLDYLTALYNKYFKANDFNRYGSRLVKIPAPRLVVFYNGTDDKDDESILRLSDAFPDNSKDGDVEVIVHMLNVNYGHNKALLDACMPLHDYSLFIAKTREYQATNTPEASVDLAIKALPDDSKIREFLESHRSEVTKMYLTEYDEAEHMRLLEIEKQREFEEIRKANQREIEEVRAAGRQKIEEVRAETQVAAAEAIAISLRLIREGATTVKELTDHGVPEKIAQAFFDDKDLISEGKRDKDE